MLPLYAECWTDNWKDSAILLLRFFFAQNLHTTRSLMRSTSNSITNFERKKTHSNNNNNNITNYWMDGRNGGALSLTLLWFDFRHSHFGVDEMLWYNCVHPFHTKVAVISTVNILMHIYIAISISIFGLIIFNFFSAFRFTMVPPCRGWPSRIPYKFSASMLRRAMDFYLLCG